MSARPYRDPCRDYASEARDDHEIPRTTPMGYYTPYRTERGWRFRCCMNAESEPFKSEQECRAEAAKELSIDTKRSRLVGVMGDIYREAFGGINTQISGGTSAASPS